MNDPSQHEIDDELLSAYLDDELSADERALVESRLAADPAARHTLEQLRNVSQSVRDMPAENIGHDLRNSILRRIQTTASRAVLGPESPAAPDQPSPRPQTDSALPIVTIGRTMRGWVWASAAIAAAVLIMVLQPDHERNADLPDIAQSDRSRGESAASKNRNLAENRSTDRAAERQFGPATAASEAPPPAAPAPGPQDSATSGRASVATDPTSEPAPNSDQFEPDTLALRYQGESTRDKTAAMAPLAAAESAAGTTARGGGAGGVVPPAAAAPAAGTVATAKQPVVVRVLAKRAAVENNQFEALLRKHNVDVEPAAQRLDAFGTLAAGEPSIETPAPAERAPADAPTNEKSEIESKDESPDAVAQQGPQDDENIEIVLVDAPSSTILSCMNELNNDAENYLGISVEGASSPDEKSQAAATAAEKKQTSELVRFNRGIVPRSKEALADVDHFYDYLGDDVAQRQDQQQVFVKSGDFNDGKTLEERSLDDGSRAERGRARRLQLRVPGKSESLQSASNPDTYGGLYTLDAKPKQRWSLDQLAEPAAPDRDRMQVLFVIRPSDEEPAPSLKAKNKAQ